MVSVDGPVQDNIAEKTSSTDSLSNEERGIPHLGGDAEAVFIIGSNRLSWFSRNRSLIRHVKLFALAALVFGWWISATVLQATRHRWIVQTFFAWSFIAIITFRFIPNSVVTHPVEAVWIPLIQKPFFALPKSIRYGLGWLSLLTIVLGSAFGFEVENVRYFLKSCYFSEDESHLKPLTDPPRVRNTVTVRSPSLVWSFFSSASGQPPSTGLIFNGTPSWSDCSFSRRSPFLCSSPVLASTCSCGLRLSRLIFSIVVS